MWAKEGIHACGLRLFEKGMCAGPRLSTSSGDTTASLPTGAGASASQATLSSEGSRRGARGGGGAVALPSARCGVLYAKNSTTASCVCGNTHACQASGRRRRSTSTRHTVERQLCDRRAPTAHDTAPPKPVVARRNPHRHHSAGLWVSRAQCSAQSGRVAVGRTVY